MFSKKIEDLNNTAKVGNQEIPRRTGQVWPWRTQ